jgi:hypothetical protein
MPFTVVGDVENDDPLPGVLIDAPWVGGAFSFVAAIP